MEKRYYSFLLFLSVCLFSCAPSGDEDDPEPDPDYTLTVTIDEPQSVSRTVASIFFSVEGEVVDSRGICYSTSENPTVTASKIEVDKYASSCELKELSEGTTYYVRAYATNVKGTVYSKQVSFTTLVDYPLVETLAVTEITDTGAKSGGTIQKTGGGDIIACGVQCRKSTGVFDEKIVGTLSGNTFTVALTGLEPNVKYFVRAYAENSQGVSLGEDVEFTTQEGQPSVSTSEPSFVTANSAKVSLDVLSKGGAETVVTGFFWGDTPQTELTGTKVNEETYLELTGLTPNTTYYARSFVTNAAGTVYGEEKSFTTMRAINFTDSEFRRYCLDFDKNKDGEVSPEEVQYVNTVFIATSYQVTNLKGIEYFTTLESLHCYMNGLKELDVSANKALKTLSCHGNSLPSLDVSKNTLLENLYCYNNLFTAIDVRNNTKLVEFSCYNNQISTLDLARNINLENLQCDGNPISILDVSMLPKLRWLTCDKCNLSSLDVSQNLRLDALVVTNNPLKTIFLSTEHNTVGFLIPLDTKRYYK